MDIDISSDVAMTLGQQQLTIWQLRKRIGQLEAELEVVRQMDAESVHVTHQPTLRTVPNEDGEPVQV